MGIENAIAQFGWEVGQNLQDTTRNALLRREERQRYNDKKNMLLQQQERADQALLQQQEREDQELLDKREADFTRRWVQAVYSAPPEAKAQVYAGGLNSARKQGFDVTGVPEQYSDEVLYTLAGAVGLDMSQPKNDMPSNVQEWQYFNTLSPGQQNKYLNMKRSGNAINLQDRFIYRGPGGDVQDEYTVGIKPQDMPENVAAKEQAKAEGKATGEAVAGLSGAEAEASEMLALLNKAKNHQGLKDATGLSSVLNPIAAPGSPRRDFLVLLDQLKGKAFLQAFESLKGGGQITEVEGRKATEAMARLNTAQSEGEFTNALMTAKGINENNMNSSFLHI